MLLHNSFPGKLPRRWHFLRPRYSTTSGPNAQSHVDFPTTSHHDISSFLEYASRVGADPQSPVYVGTLYEYTVQSSLIRLGISLKRVGGKSDYGIDLLGTWKAPSVMSPLKVLVQCKASCAKPKPSEIRELEGAFVGAPRGWRGAGVLGLLVSQREATKGVRDAIGRSRWPMGFVMCTDKGKILQMLWNRKADDEGLLGVGVAVKYEGGAREDQEIVLTWQNIPRHNATV